MPSKKRPASINDEASRRHSPRPPKKRDFFHTESLISRGVLEFKIDECRGINQPGGVRQSPQEKLAVKLHSKGLDLFLNYLKPSNWICRKRTNSPDGYVYVHSGITMKQEIPNENIFITARDIYEQFQRDGETMSHILARCARSIGNVMAEKSVSNVTTNQEDARAESSTTKNEQEKLASETRYPNPLASDAENNATTVVAVKREPLEEVETPESDHFPDSEATTNPGFEVATTTTKVSPSNALSPAPVGTATATREHVSSDDTAATNTPSLGILQRLARIEEAYGLPKENPFSKEKVLKRRIERHEEYLALTDGSNGLSILERLKRLETDIGI